MAKSKKEATKKRLQKHKEENKTLKQSKNWYPVHDIKKRITRKCKSPKPSKLRASITPGTILILLTGRFRGKRVVFLKRLNSGLLLVTGPFKFNGVPLKRVNQAYVLATKTKITLGNISGLDKVDDKFFTKVPVKRSELGEVIIPTEEEKKKRITDNRKSTQSSVDTEVRKAIQGTPFLKEYLQNRFGLKNGQQAHSLVY
jgi:large subunit ribosomal protein L6e